MWLDYYPHKHDVITAEKKLAEEKFAAHFHSCNLRRGDNRKCAMWESEIKVKLKRNKSEAKVK